MVLEKDKIEKVRINEGKKEIVLKWPTKEDPDKTWGARGFEREDR